MKLHDDQNVLCRLAVWREVAEETFNDLTWLSETHATIECPGSRSHSKPGNAALFLDHFPTVTCFHQSCKLAVDAANQELRSECQRRCREAGLADEWTAEDKAAWIKRKREKEAEKEATMRRMRRMRDRLTQIVDTYYRHLHEWPKQSPDGIVIERSSRHLAAFLEAYNSRFGADSRVWIGNVRNSGQKWHMKHFVTASEWFERACSIGSLQWKYQHICPVNFANWKLLKNRVEAAVVERRLLAIEFDDLAVDPTDNKALGLAVVRYICEKYDLGLFSACDSGNKSVHALVTWPQDRETYDATVLELEALGADPGPMSSLAATCRLPGAMRLDDEGFPVSWQKLYYLDPGVAGNGSSLITHPEHKPDVLLVSQQSKHEEV